MPPALRVQSLWKSYTAGVRGCSARVWALQGLTFSLEQGERVGIVGAAGAGKFTLAACILGLRRPDAGFVDAIGFAAGQLVLLGNRPCVERPQRPDCRGSGTLLLLVDDAARLWPRMDRLLLLRDGRVQPFGERRPARRVAEREGAVE
jgi:ABC-type protease/lipase transport system fused ATPase/permease subunit